MRQRYLVVATVAVVILGGCEVFRSAPDDEEMVVEEPAETPQAQAARIVEAIGELRRWDHFQDVEVVEAQKIEESAKVVPETVGDEWALFEEMLFGGEEIDLFADDASWAQRGNYDGEASQLSFAGDPRTEDDSALAVAMIAGMAMEEQKLGALPEVETVDQWLTREVIRRAGPVFVAAAQSAERFEKELGIDELADRPELATHLPGIGERLEAIDATADMMQQAQFPEGAEWLDGAVEQLVLRKALSLGAALYRAGGWAGVEWGRSEPPTASAQVVHPRRWFDGEGATKIEWPRDFEKRQDDEGWQKVKGGHVGPATTSLWLEGLVGTRAARSIYGGWRGDTYRLYTRGEGDSQERAFHWMMTWESPHDAQEMASAAEAVLGHYHGNEHRRLRFRTAAQGLNVAISIYNVDRSEEELNETVDGLAASRVVVLPGEQAPFGFVPTLYDRYVERTEGSTLDLDRETWTDTASGWHTEIDALSGWTVQRANEPHVRWFANYPDGTLIQWTTELVDPFRPEFGSDAYVEQLKKTFAESMSAEEEPTVEVVDEPQEQTIRMEVAGKLEGRPLVLRIWQWRRGDVLVSYSVQGPEAFFGERLDQAEAVLSGLVRHGEAVEQEEMEPETDPSEDEGIIEFRVEDEEE